jgi:protein phosphatase
MAKAVPMCIVISTGLNLARVLGDNFLKEQDSRFSSDPYVSPAVHIAEASTAFAVIAR